MNAEIRVLHCIARMNAGGTATLLNGLMSQMGPGVNQLLVYGQCESNEIDFLAKSSPLYPTVFVSTLGRAIRPANDIRSFIELRRIAKEFSPDVLHTHTFKAGVIGRLVALTLRPRPKVVHTFHGHLLTGYFSKTVTRLIVLIEKSLARITDVLLAVGPEVKSDLIKAGIGVRNCFDVIIPGIPDPTVVSREQARSVLGLSDGFVVAFIGRLTQIKRIDRFIAALKELDVPYQAIIAGEGELRDIAEEEAERNNVNTKFLGWRDDIETVFAASDVVTLTSDNEGLGLVLIEAQLRGIPVVATAVGSVPSALVHGKTGMLVDPTPSAVASGIQQIAELTPQHRVEMSNAAREFAHQNFSMQRFAAEHQSLYRALLSAELPAAQN